MKHRLLRKNTGFDGAAVGPPSFDRIVSDSCEQAEVSTDSKLQAQLEECCPPHEQHASERRARPLSVVLYVEVMSQCCAVEGRCSVGQGIGAL
jgi:hypothetical protein